MGGTEKRDECLVKAKGAVQLLRVQWPGGVTALMACAMRHRASPPSIVRFAKRQTTLCEEGDRPSLPEPVTPIKTSKLCVDPDGACWGHQFVGFHARVLRVCGMPSSGTKRRMPAAHLLVQAMMWVQFFQRAAFVAEWKY